MSDYTAPVEDMDFVLRHIVDLAGLSAFEQFSHVDVDETRGILDEAGRFFAEVVAPTNRAGDVTGSQWQSDGSVKTPDEFGPAYEKFVEAGWGSVPFSPEIGGGGFPWLIGIALQEMLTSGNMALSLCPLLTQGAVHLLEAHGSEEQRMITGQKIFITFGEHDLTSNIVHLVLARTADAPPGTKGISVFIVPKFILDDSGQPGDENSLSCVSIEHKLGIHGSPTCVMSFDDATGYLIGEEQSGMASMFTMMNSARLSVGLEGLAVAERAYQQAVQYSVDRTQGGRPDRAKGEAAPIIEHPDVRRMLLTMRSSIEAMRCLCYLNARALDAAHVATDSDARREAQELADMLTPLSKAWCTDLGNELTSLAVQVHGGMGFVEETGIAQHYRDIRIGAIYEGTNGIQALDLLGRKLPMRGGAVMFELLDQITAEAESLDGELADVAKPLLEGVEAVRESSMWMASNIGDAAMAGATPYLRLVATVVGGWLMAQSARVASELLASGSTTESTEFLEQKIISARFFTTQLLPAQIGLTAQVMGGNELFAAATFTDS